MVKIGESDRLFVSFFFISMSGKLVVYKSPWTNNKGMAIEAFGKSLLDEEEEEEGGGESERDGWGQNPKVKLE